MYSVHPRPISRAASPNYGAHPPLYGAPTPVRPDTGYPQPVSPYSAPAPIRPISRGPSPAPPGMSPGDHYRLPSTSDFQIEKRARSPNPYGRPPIMPQADAGHRDDLLYRDHVAALIAAKNQQFAVSSSVPCDPASLVLFFRSKNGISHSLDFPIDTAHSIPPPLDVLIAACRPHQVSDYDDYSGHRAALFYPPNLPMSVSLELANSPILDAIRNGLLPNLPYGSYLTALKDRLDVLDVGSHLATHSPAMFANDGRVATVIVTLPIKYKGGAIAVRNAQGVEEKFLGGSGKIGDVEWVAFGADCQFGIETVQKGCRLSLSYGIFVKNLNPAMSPNAEFLLAPTDRFFDLLSPILNLSRGKSIAFYLNHTYGVNPAEELASIIIPQLKGADALIHNAFRLHKLAPELHYTAGGYIWASDRTLEFFGDGVSHNAGTFRSSTGAYGRVHSPRSPAMPSIPGPYGAKQPGPYGGAYHPEQTDQEIDAVRAHVQANGAVSLAEANITLLTEWNNAAPIVGKEKVYFVSNGELEKLVVNVLLVVFIP